MLSVNSVQLKCIFDAQRRKAALPGRGLEYVDSQGVKHPAVAFTFTAADGVEMPLEVRVVSTGMGVATKNGLAVWRNVGGRRKASSYRWRFSMAKPDGHSSLPVALPARRREPACSSQ